MVGWDTQKRGEGIGDEKERKKRTLMGMDDNGVGIPSEGKKLKGVSEVGGSSN